MMRHVLFPSQQRKTSGVQFAVVRPFPIRAGTSNTLRPAAFLRRKVPTGVDRLSSMRRNDAPLSLGKDFLRGVTGWRGDNAISFADHFHGLALIQITTESAIRQITVREACDRTRERFRTAQHVHSVLLCTNYSVRDGRKRANQNQGSQHFVSIGFFGRIVQRAARTQHATPAQARTKPIGPGSISTSNWRRNLSSRVSVHMGAACLDAARRFSAAKGNSPSSTR
jgi:hypothetical protein